MAGQARASEPQDRILRIATAQALFALTAPSVTALFRPDDDRPLATLRKLEIEEHAARVEAGTIKPA